MNNSIRIDHGDCLATFRGLPYGSLDAVVTDPPAGVAFMGIEWDGDKGGRDRWIAWLSKRLEAMRHACKPGAYMLCWALPRTSHWTALAIEDAGWMIVDRIAHIFGQGFPKHKSKLKPAVEDWWLAWKPDGGSTPLPGLDACRIPTTESLISAPVRRYNNTTYGHGLGYGTQEEPGGRWPTNLVLSHSPDCNGRCVDGCPVALIGDQTGDDGAARFFPQFDHDPSIYSRQFKRLDILKYSAKASSVDKGEGNSHPTVKSLPLCRWLVRLITPPGGIVADGFVGSGTVPLAASLEGFRFVGAELEKEFYEIALSRLASETAKTPLFRDL